MRREYQMSEEQFTRLLDASKPTPAMWGSGGAELFSTPQENANRAWQQLASELGFVWDTVTPIPGKGERWFAAEAAPASSPSPEQQAVSPVADLSIARRALDSVDKLLAEGGYSPDSSARHQLAIARSVVVAASPEQQGSGTTDGVQQRVAAAQEGGNSDAQS